MNCMGKYALIFSFIIMFYRYIHISGCQKSSCWTLRSLLLLRNDGHYWILYRLSHSINLFSSQMPQVRSPFRSSFSYYVISDKACCLCSYLWTYLCPQLSTYACCLLCTSPLQWVTMRRHVLAGLESNSGIRELVFPSGQSPAWGSSCRIWG